MAGIFMVFLFYLAYLRVAAPSLLYFWVRREYLPFGVWVAMTVSATVAYHMAVLAL